MREVIADRDRNQREGEGARDDERRQAPQRDRAHDGADPDIGTTEHQPEGEQPRRPDRRQFEVAQDGEVCGNRGFELVPFRRAQRPPPPPPPPPPPSPPPPPPR